MDCSFYTHLDPNPFPQTLVEVDGKSGSIRLTEGYRMTVTSGGQSATEIADAPLHNWSERPCVQGSIFNIQRHWVERLTQGKEPATSGEDNLRTLQLVFAAYESAETGRTVEVGRTCRSAGAYLHTL